MPLERLVLPLGFNPGYALSSDEAYLGPPYPAPLHRLALPPTLTFSLLLLARTWDSVSRPSGDRIPPDAAPDTRGFGTRRFFRDQGGVFPSTVPSRTVYN